MENFSIGKKTATLTYFHGEVVDTNSSVATEVSGGVTTSGHLRVSSQIMREQKIWVVAKSGEERAFDIDGHDIAIRPGNKVTIISAETKNSNGAYGLYVINHSTKEHQQMFDYRNVWFNNLKLGTGLRGDLFCFLIAYLILAYCASLYYGANTVLQELYVVYTYSYGLDLIFQLFLYLAGGLVAGIFIGLIPACLLFVPLHLLKATFIDWPRYKKFNALLQKAATRCLQQPFDSQR